MYKRQDVFHIREMAVGAAGVVLADEMAGQQDVRRADGDARDDQQQDDAPGVQPVGRPPIAQQRQRDAQSRSGDAQPGIGVGKEQQPRKCGVNGAERYECDGERAGTVCLLYTSRCV